MNRCGALRPPPAGVWGRSPQGGVARFLAFLCGFLALIGGAVAEEEALTRTSQRGPVVAHVRLVPSEPRLGDEVTLTLTVEAEEGIDVMMPAFGHALDRFAIVDYLPKETVAPDGQTVVTQRYTLHLPGSGQQAIPPLMIEFVDRRPGHPPAPEGEEAYELLTESLPFEVASVIPQGAAQDLKPPMGALAPHETSHVAFWIGLFLLVLAVAAPVAWRYGVRWRGQVRQRTAYDIAHGRLQTMMSRTRPTPEEMSTFFVELSDIIRRYLEDRFQIRASERTTEEFLESAIHSPDLTAEHRGFLHQFLAYADRVKFARHLPQVAHVDQALAAAGQFLDQTREVSHV